VNAVEAITTKDAAVLNEKHPPPASTPTVDPTEIIRAGAGHGSCAWQRSHQDAA